jgi:hypothetical protein
MPSLCIVVVEVRQSGGVGGGEKKNHEQYISTTKIMQDGWPVADRPRSANRVTRNVLYSPRCPLASNPLPNGSGTDTDAGPSMWVV